MSSTPVSSQDSGGDASGYSAPSVRGERLVLHHRLLDEEIVEACEAATGKPLWRHAYPCWVAPVLSRQRLYLRSEDQLMCFDWRR